MAKKNQSKESKDVQTYTFYAMIKTHDGWMIIRAESEGDRIVSVQTVSEPDVKAIAIQKMSALLTGQEG